MKKFSGKLLAACLVMILLTALCAACALADTVSTVKITLDTAALDLSTNWTEGEVDRRLGGASGVTTPGVRIDSGNTRLLYMFNGSYSGVGSGTERVTAERDYLYRFWLRVNDGSDWARGIISCTDYTSAASNTSLKVYLNGTQRTDAVYRYNEYWNGVEVIIPAPALPKVTSLELRGTNWVLTKGDSFRYPVDITAENGADRTLVWTVTGQSSAGTKIDQNGRLTLGSDETAGTVTVKVVSRSTPSVYDQAKVTVAAKGYVSTLKLNCDFDGLRLTTDSTEDEADKRVLSNISESTVGCHIRGGCLDVIKYDTPLWVNHSTEKLSVDKKYYVRFELIPDNGYTWPGSVLDFAYQEHRSIKEYSGLKLYVNGVECKTALAGFNGYINLLIIDVPVPDHLPEADLTKARVTGIKAKTYTGKAIRQDITVTLDGVALTQGKDYKVTYSNNKNVGKAAMEIKGIGHYKGTIVKLFTIKPVKIKRAALSYTSKVYTGKALKPAVKVTALVGGRTLTLKKNRDYNVAYADNINAGTATVTVRGIGNYTGTVVKTFTIKPVKLGAVTLEFTRAVYTGKAIKPKVTVKAEVNGKTVTLKKARDYTVKYVNNVNVGTAKVIVTGKGNFTGIITKTFKIVKK